MRLGLLTPAHVESTVIQLWSYGSEGLPQRYAKSATALSLLEEFGMACRVEDRFHLIKEGRSLPRLISEAKRFADLEEPKRAGGEWQDVRYLYMARTVGVRDGDTIVFELNHGLSIRSTKPVRIEGIDCYERYRGDEEERERGRLATIFTEEWLAARNGGDWPFLVETVEDRHSFDRVRGTVWAMTGENLAEDLVRAGHTKSHTIELLD